MENKQVNLLFRVLKLLSREGVLAHLVVAGSWCLYFYKYYFHKRGKIATLRTRDIDFVVIDPKKIKLSVDLPVLLKEFGFIIDYRGEQGYMRLVHPEFFIEFMVPERGRGFDRAFPLPSLNINAQALRFLDVLYIKTITVKVKGIKIKLPHPACFLLHKMIVYKRRPQKERRLKDIEQIKRIVELLHEADMLSSVKRIFLKVHPRWQRKIINNLKELKDIGLADILQ